MLSVGVFATPKTIVTFYEVSERGHYRIDFVRDGAIFNMDSDSVIYSLIRDKFTYIYGDPTLYEEYMNFRSKIEHAPMRSKKQSKWFNGAYTTTIEEENTKLGYSKYTVLKNNKFSESTIVGDGYKCTLTVTDMVYGVKARPLNFSEYTKLSLTKETIDETRDSIFHSLDYLKMKYNLEYIDDPKNDFVVVEGDVELARKRLQMYRESEFPFRCVDTETTGLDICLYGEDKMVGIILASDPYTSTYFPFRHDGDFNLPMSFLPELMAAVKEKEDITVAHNKKFDREVFLSEGYDIHMRWCSLQLSIVLNPTIGKGIHGLKENTTSLFGYHVLELNEIFIDPRNIRFQTLTPEIIKYYACPDGTNPLKLLEAWLKKLPKKHYPLWKLECDLSDVKADQEFYGTRVDVKRYEHQYKNCNYILEILLESFRKLTKEDGNINSSQVLSNLIYNKMHCPILLRTNTGAPSVSTAAIKKLAGKKTDTPVETPIADLTDLDGKVIIKGETLANSKYPALVILTEYKKYIKLKTAFYARFERTMKTGRVFFWINQNGAATGRQSSPMHQLPPELKDCILADTEEHNFWGPDYSQIELRMIAYAAGETELIEMAKNPENDIHRVIGSLISGKEMWEITPEERSIGKRRNFGVVYLISKFGLAQQIFGPGYTKDDVHFCEQQLKEFFKKFKRIDRYIKKNGVDVRKNGFASTLWYKRLRLFKEVFDKDIDPQKLSSIIRMANNVPIQGTAADYMKCAENLYNAYIYEHGWNELKDGFPLVRIMLSCHDEVLISAHNSIPDEEIVKMITTCMEIPIDGAPPFFAQPAKMDSWGGHSIDALSMPIQLRDKLVKDYDDTGKSVFCTSHFNLVLPDEAKHDINTSTETYDSLFEKWLPRTQLQYEKGDYITEAREQDIKDALNKYIWSGSTHLHVDNYLEILNAYRDDELRNYMVGLIQKYGTDYKVVGAHVRHPSLTFALLDLYNKKIPKDMEHVDRIVEAARMYIEHLLSDTKEIGVVPSTKEVKVQSDKDTYVEQLDVLINFDRDGNIEFADPDDEDTDVFSNYYDDDESSVIEEYMESKLVYAWDVGDVLAIDIRDLEPGDVDKVLSYLWDRRNENGFYRAFLVHKGNMVDTKIKIEDVNMEELNEILRQLSSRRVTS